MNKWTGGQNGGNHGHTTDYRKNNGGKKNEDRVKDLWDNIKCSNILFIGGPEWENIKKGPEKILRDNSWKLP